MSSQVGSARAGAFVGRPTSLKRVEGLLTVLFSGLRMNSGGEDDGGGRDERRINQDQPLILDSNSTPTLNNRVRY